MKLTKPELILAYRNFLAFCKTQEARQILAALPFFFSWVPVLTWFNQEIQTKRVCFYSAINTCLFLLAFVFSILVSGFPYLGLLLANSIHFLGILAYLGISGFLIYATRGKKNIDLPILANGVSVLERWTAPIAQLDRVSDYGSEG